MKKGPSRERLDELRARSMEVLRAKTHCKNGHEFTPENLLPSAKGWRVCKVCHYASTRRRAKEGRLSQSKVQAVLTALDDGKTLNEITGHRGDRYVGGAIVHQDYLTSFLKRTPQLKKIVLERSRVNAGLMRRRSVVAPAILKNDGRDAFDLIMRATARLFDPVRGTVQSDMWTDVAEGRLKLSEISGSVQNYVRKYNRDNKHSVMSRWGDRSLDAAMTDDGFSLMDTLADGSAWTIPVSTGTRVGPRRNG